MTKIKLNDFEIDQESESVQEIKIVNLGTGNDPVVKKFEFNNLRHHDAVDYAQVKQKYGPLAATDPERVERRQKDRRFSLNPLLRDPLSIEQEERRVIEEKVRSRIDTLADQAKASAAEVGYQDGLKKGFEESYKKLLQDGQENLNKLAELVSEVEKAKDQIFRANERFLIELIYKISKMVLLKELAVDKQYIVRLATELVNLVGAKDHITMKINVEDLKMIDTLKAELRKNFGELSNLNIEASSQVKRGSCQIETEWNAMDASIDKQLQGIYESLFGQERKDDSTPSEPEGNPGET